MKYYIKYLSVIFISALLLACSGNQDQTSDPDIVETENTQMQEAEDTKQNDEPEYDFRNTKWGMTKEEVKENEPGKLLFDEENVLEYRVFIDDIHAQASYKFKDGKLIRGGYYFPKKYDNKNDYISTYERIKAMIIASKGSPALDKIVPVNPSAKIDEDNKGQAVCDGDLIYGTQWDNTGTDIQLVFRGEEGTCYLTVNYIMSK